MPSRRTRTTATIFSFNRVLIISLAFVSHFITSLFIAHVGFAQASKNSTTPPPQRWANTERVALVINEAFSVEPYYRESIPFLRSCSERGIPRIDQQKLYDHTIYLRERYNGLRSDWLYKRGRGGETDIKQIIEEIHSYKTTDETNKESFVELEKELEFQKERIWDVILFKDKKTSFGYLAWIGLSYFLSKQPFGYLSPMSETGIGVAATSGLGQLATKMGLSKATSAASAKVAQALAEAGWLGTFVSNTGGFLGTVAKTIFHYNAALAQYVPASWLSGLKFNDSPYFPSFLKKPDGIGYAGILPNIELVYRRSKTFKGLIKEKSEMNSLYSNLEFLTGCYFSSSQNLAAYAEARPEFKNLKDKYWNTKGQAIPSQLTDSGFPGGRQVEAFSCTPLSPSKILELRSLKEDGRLAKVRLSTEGMEFYMSQKVVSEGSLAKGLEEFLETDSSGNYLRVSNMSFRINASQVRTDSNGFSEIAPVPLFKGDSAFQFKAESINLPTQKEVLQSTLDLNFKFKYEIELTQGLPKTFRDRSENLAFVISSNPALKPNSGYELVDSAESFRHLLVCAPARVWRASLLQ
ncbi:MAG: hypothetical protein COT74_12865 [Bdellovibrionales bacterium CG10_big_fil_rev_8_21_14_0_10_45_34]|nr:MAG: hypothetical protein COT74_12865 [Bdellovibrionales bacterium CG10_big_fil_rev_8_21_14_0_10_45_34]